MLQETWMDNDEMSVLSNRHTDFCGYGISSMNTEPKLVFGHPYEKILTNYVQLQNITMNQESFI